LLQFAAAICMTIEVGALVGGSHSNL
jgi:hypothetical protein